VKTPVMGCDIFMRWTDLTVPDVTTYSMFSFDRSANLPTTPPVGNQLNGSPLLHGATGFCLVPAAPPPTGLWYYQVRGVNCDGSLVGP
jgi:hypothetical protein